MRVLPLILFFSTLLMFTGAFAEVSDLDVAKKALRDNLWEIARMRATKVDNDEAKAIILESYAHEGKWKEILSALDSWGEVPSTDIFVFYRTLAEAKINGSIGVVDVLSKFKFSDKSFSDSLASLCVQISLRDGDKTGAKKIVEDFALYSADDDSKVISAEAYNIAGDHSKAVALWREIASSTNVGETAFAMAAWNLGDTNSLKSAYSKIEKDVELKRRVGLKLGTVLITDKDSFEEGRKIIAFLVKESPGTEGAMEALLALADKHLKNARYEEAENAFHNAIEAWPEAARNYIVHEGRGWALLELKRYDDAVLSFLRAEECALDDNDKATAILKQGEILSFLGRGEEAMAKYRIVKNDYPDTPAGKKLIRILHLKDLESRGRDLYRDFRFAEAYEIFSEIAKLDPASKPRMDYLEMLCFYGQGKDDEASSMAENLSLNCEDPSIKAEATLWLAKFYYNERHWSESCGLFSNYATNMMPSSARAPYALLWASRAAFAGGDSRRTIDLVTKLAKDYPDSSERPSAYILQGEALIETSRFDEAIVVLNNAVNDIKITPAERVRARVLLADALFVMGADNPVRYDEALKVYLALYMGEKLETGKRINLAFKMARTFEKLDRMELALDQYYGGVICAYRDARARGEVFDDEVKSNFARAAFRLSDEYERRGQDEKAKNILRLVIRSDVKVSAEEARRRLKRIKKKGSF
ncbi:MAG: tetratricopeptide repeat protein [Kiritimatiellae bacterium]|nr:tetratricopeptide repeat protein [Kiritimatiellia bacterium]